MADKIIFLDNNSTTPVDKDVLSTMLPYFSDFYYNPASSHFAGKIIKKQMDNAGEEIAALLNAQPDEIFFTSGSTEGLNLALKGLALNSNNRKKHIITCKTEHKAVLDTCKYLENIGFEIEYLDVSNDGLININLLKSMIRNDTLLVAIMWANNETGILQPVAEIGRITEENGTLFLCDATQAVGKIKTDVVDNHVDILVFSGHKMYGPKGMGGMYINKAKLKENDFEIQIHGGKHQNGLRSGTFNTPGIIGLGKACEVAMQRMISDEKKIKEIRNYFEKRIQEIQGVIIHARNTKRLFNTSNVYIPNLDADLFIGMNRDIAVSNGSACNSSVVEASHVLVAMGLQDEIAMNSLRVSFGKFNWKMSLN